MRTSRLFLLISMLGVPLVLGDAAPASAFIALDSPGWLFTPLTAQNAPSGECVNPVTDYNCYTDLTPSGIRIIGQQDPGASPTYSYSLGLAEQAQQISFSYSYQNPNTTSQAFVQIGASTPILLSGAGGPIGPLPWNPGEALVFGIDQGLDSSFSGELSITGFTSDAAPVPAPLPLGGSLALMGWSRALRRRIKASANK